jgi:fructose-1-phosphate kinase PfkB-like protein
MARILTVTPNPLLDMVTDQPLVAGRITRVGKLRIDAEGKRVNVAKVLHAHGHEVMVHGLGGGPAADWFESILAGCGLTVRLTRTRARIRCGLLAAQPGVDPSAIIEDGFAATAAEAGTLLAAVMADLPGTDLVVISGSAPSPPCQGLARDLAGLCRRAGIPCWVDCHGPAMAAALAAGPLDLAKPNREEHAALGDWTAAMELHVTAGAEVVLARMPDGTSFEVVPPPITVVNPIGSGDCYLAGLAHARLGGLPPVEQLRYAAAAGAANAAELVVAAIGPAAIAPLVPHTVVREVHRGV